MKIRRLVLVDGHSMRSVARSTGLSRNTIRKYIEDDEPPNYKRHQPNLSPVLSGFEAQLNDWYSFDLTRPI